MKNLITIVLAVLFILFLGCSDENPNPTSTTQKQDLIDLAKKGKGKGKGGTSKTCTYCDGSYNIICTSSKKLNNGVKVTWTSSFGGFDYDYAQGSGYTVTVTWSVDQGSATFKSFTAKKKTWTPKRVDGDWNYDAGSLTVTMTSMHRSVEPDWQGYIGNGHFKLELKVGGIKAKLGVNVHLEDPDYGYSPRCP